MRAELLPLDPAAYEPHALHSAERVWTETNCYVDLWIEVLHALGLEPTAAGAFALASDFEDDQWTFFKHPAEDLRELYGIEVAEMSVWRPVPDHVEEHLRRGRLLTVEADAWYLPDTRGVSYGLEHVKTTIVPQMIDNAAHRLGYFHNAGYYELEGDDFAGALGLEPRASDRLPPYVELVRLDRLHRSPPGGQGSGCHDLVGAARSTLQRHLARRPSTNPVARFASRLEDDLGWLTGAGLDTFHLYAFATCRQCGAASEVAAAFLSWMGARDGGGLEVAEQSLLGLASQAKALQFALARAATGRKVDVSGLLGQMAGSWDVAMTALDERYAC